MNNRWIKHHNIVWCVWLWLTENESIVELSVGTIIYIFLIFRDQVIKLRIKFILIDRKLNATWQTEVDQIKKILRSNANFRSQASATLLQVIWPLEYLNANPCNKKVCVLFWALNTDLSLCNTLATLIRTLIS